MDQQMIMALLLGLADAFTKGLADAATIQATRRQLVTAAEQNNCIDDEDVSSVIPELVELVFDQTVESNPGGLPGLFPFFASACGCSGNTTGRFPNIDWTAYDHFASLNRIPKRSAG